MAVIEIFSQINFYIYIGIGTIHTYTKHTQPTHPTSRHKSHTHPEPEVHALVELIEKAEAKTRQPRFSSLPAGKEEGIRYHTVP